MNEFDPIEASLRDLPYVEDGGFTDRVLAALPRRRRDLRHRVLGVAAVVAALLAAVALPGALASLAALLAATAPGLPLWAAALAASLAAGTGFAIASGSAD